MNPACAEKLLHAALRISRLHVSWYLEFHLQCRILHHGHTRVSSVTREELFKIRQVAVMHLYADIIRRIPSRAHEIHHEDCQQ